MSLVSKSFSEIVTFSRSSNATRVGPTGLVEWAPHNFMLRSQEFNNASWLKYETTVFANDIPGPDGTVTADKLIETTLNDYHYIYQLLSVTAGTTYTYSIYAKAGERNVFQVTSFSGDIDSFVHDFNLATGAASGAGATISAIGNGWYRCSGTITANATNAGVELNFLMIGSGGVPNYAGTAGYGFYIWGAQFVLGPNPLDYVPTTTAAVYGPRFDYDPVTLAARGLLIEEQRTNLILQSNVGNIGTNWQQYGTAVLTQNYSTAPDGTVSAGRLAVTTSGTVRVVSSSLTNGTTYAASIWMKSNTASSYSIDIQIGDNSIGTFTVTPTWQRFSGTGTPLVTGYNFIDLEIFASLDISVWGAQLEAGSFATSYIPTLASTVTRSADVASVNTLSPWWNNSEGSFYFEGDVAFANGKYPGLYKTGTTNGQRVGQFMNPGTTSANSSFYRITDTVTSGSISNQAVFKLASAYSGSDVATALNGGAAATASASGSLTLPTILYLGFFDEYMSGHIRRLAYYPRRLTNAELQALTA